MPGAQPALGKEVPDRGRQLQQPHGVRDGRAIPAHRVRDLLLRHPELGRELLVPGGLLQDGERRALDVLHQREHQHRAVVHLPDQRRDLPPAQPHDRAPAPLARDELPARASLAGAHDDGLEQPALPDRRDQVGQLLFRELAPRLERVRDDLRHRDRTRRAAVQILVAEILTEQSAQPAP